MTRVDIGLAGRRGPGGRRPPPLEARLLTRAVRPVVAAGPRRRRCARSTADFQATTALIAAIALFAGAFLIFNTLSMTVAERIREVGLLRAAGATRGQVTSFMLTQALAARRRRVARSASSSGSSSRSAMVAFVRTVGVGHPREPGRAARRRR